VQQDIETRREFGLGVFGAGVLAGAVFALFTYKYLAIDPLSNKGNQMSYPDIAVLVLTCVTIIITCAALVIGMLGVFGFQKIKEDAVASAIKQSLSRVEKEMSDGGDLNKLLLLKFSQFENRYSGVAPRADDWGNENSNYGDGN
jgi:hypothetical protein